MFNLKSMRKSKLSLALSAVLAGGCLVSLPAHAVQVAEDGLGDAIIFPYFTANNGWQTFIRLINTSNQAVVVKVRFREAANSRELRDFLVALSPNDMWSAWTDARAFNNQPGIRTNDTSCVFDLPNTGPNTFTTINGHLKGLPFSSAAFTGAYADGSPATTDQRLREGYIEVIGVAAFGQNTDIARAITHNNSTGVPENCSEAQRLYRNTAFVGPGSGVDVQNVLGATAQLINVANGEGAGFDPVVLANFQNQSLRQESLFRILPTGVGHGSWPTLDSADPHSVLLTTAGTAVSSVWDATLTGNSFFNSPTVAASQLLANGNPAVLSRSKSDMNGDADLADGPYDIFEADDATPIATNVSEGNIPAAVVTALSGRRIVVLSEPTVAPPTNGRIRIAFPTEAAARAFVVAQSVETATGANPARLTNIPHDALADGTAAAVRGGVDAVSAILAKNSVINEWAAQNNPASIIKDYFTQWVVTFPTKHYYVDLQDDPDLTDFFAPTLVDPRGDAIADLNDAFAPFTNEFNTAANGQENAIGLSCENYGAILWDREESELGYTSPAAGPRTRICNEVNVISFTDAYATRGLGSAFGAVVPTESLPPDAMATSFTRATRGWARLTFTGTGAVTGLTSPASTYFAHNLLPNSAAPIAPTVPAPLALSSAVVNYPGLPVIGFGLTSYTTGNSATNHNSINAHKYESGVNDGGAGL